jgi:hypothetical protein
VVVNRFLTVRGEIEGQKAASERREPVMTQITGIRAGGKADARNILRALGAVEARMKGGKDNASRTKRVLPGERLIPLSGSFPAFFVL